MSGELKDKENFGLSVLSPKTPKSSAATPRNKSSGRSFVSPKASPTFPKTPTGSSKLLRHHFAQLSLRSTPTLETPGEFTSRRRRLMDSGPVRISTTPGTERILDSGAKRILQSPNEQSHGQQGRILDDGESSCTDQSLQHYEAFTWEYPSSQPTERMDCRDPVAFTLLRGGEDEDHDWLVQQDQERQGNASPNLPKDVSANLYDIYTEQHSRELVRPIPIMAWHGHTVPPM